jgi:AcrR family transcriptional regulator
MSTSAAPGPAGPTDRYHHGDLPNALRRAAVEVIAEKGLGGFSLREVARRAGVSHTAPAHHFGDMAGLLTSLAAEGFAHLAEETATAIAGIDDPAERMVALGQAYVRVGAQYPSHCEVMFRDDLLHDDDPDLEQWGWTAYGVLHGAVTALAEDEQLDLDVDAAARLCWSAMQGLLTLYPKFVHIDARYGATTPARDDLVVDFTETLVAGLRSRFHHQ